MFWIVCVLVVCLCCCVCFVVCSYCSLSCPLSSLTTFALAIKQLTTNEQHKQQQQQHTTQQTINTLGCMFGESVIFAGMDALMCLFCVCFMCVVFNVFVLYLFCCVSLCSFVVSPVLANHLRLCNTKQKQQRMDKTTATTNTPKQTKHMLGCNLGGGVFWFVRFCLFAVCCLFARFVLFAVLLLFVFVVFPVLANRLRLCNAKNNNNKRTKQNQRTNQRTNNKLGCYFGGGMFRCGCFWVVCFCC